MSDTDWQYHPNSDARIRPDLEELTNHDLAREMDTASANGDHQTAFDAHNILDRRNRTGTEKH